MPGNSDLSTTLRRWLRRGQTSAKGSDASAVIVKASEGATSKLVDAAKGAESAPKPPERSVTGPKLFIVGLPRSGTSTLVHALRSIGFRGFAEGHFLGHLPALEEALARYYETWKADNVDGTMLNTIKLDDLILRYRVAFRKIFEELIGPPPWLDKNAEPYLMPYLHVIQWVWPDASFIFTRRRPVDFIFSARSKFPDRSLEQLCEVVAFTFSNWEKQKTRLKRYIEIDQSEFYDAGVLADKLASFLQLDEKVRPVLVENLQVQVERTATTYVKHELSDLKLAPEELETFRSHCGAIMRRYYQTVSEQALPSGLR